MTREEVIQVLRHIIQVADTSDCGIKEIDGIDEEALNMAIKALEQKPCDEKVGQRIRSFGNAESYCHRCGIKMPESYYNFCFNCGTNLRRYAGER